MIIFQKPVKIADLAFAVNKACREINKQDYAYKKQLDILSSNMNDKLILLNTIMVSSKNKIDILRACLKNLIAIFPFKMSIYADMETL